MPTTKQKRLAELIVENGTKDKPLNKKELLVKSGYTEITAKSSTHTIIDREGVKKYLTEQGFSSDNAKRVVAKILNDGEDQHKLKAADTIFKIHGDYAPEKKITLNIKGDLNTVKEHEELRLKYEQELKDKLRE